ncbi:MAG: LD-carboxypeptidase [Betaproteobacteria bacterium]
MKESLAIGIVAPSGYLTDPAALERAEAYFSGLGHRVVVDAGVYERWQRFAGTDDTRLGGLQRMVARDDIDIVLAARGGYGMARLLDRVDFDLFARSGCVFAGHSDCIALQLALLARNGMPSLAGPLACFDFGGESVSEFTAQHFWAALAQPRHAFTVSMPGQPRCAASGVLWGGNLAMVTHLLGTPNFPAIDGGILFLEEINEHPYRIERMLLQLHNAGVLDRQAAILFGDFSGFRLLENDAGYDMATVIEYLRGKTRTPILTGLPYGHIRDKVCLPIGGIGVLESDGDSWQLESSQPQARWDRLR